MEQTKNVKKNISTQTYSDKDERLENLEIKKIKNMQQTFESALQQINKNVELILTNIAKIVPPPENDVPTSTAANDVSRPPENVSHPPENVSHPPENVPPLYVSPLLDVTPPLAFTSPTVAPEISEIRPTLPGSFPNFNSCNNYLSEVEDRADMFPSTMINSQSTNTVDCAFNLILTAFPRLLRNQDRKERLHQAWSC